MGAGPKAIARAPLAAARSYGLLRTAEVLEGAAADRDIESGDWRNGILMDPEGCGDGLSRVDPCDADVDKAAGTNPARLEQEAFGVVAVDECTTRGQKATDRRARAERLLRACQGSQIEEELWTGAIAKASGWTAQQYLAREDTSDVVATSATPLEALACIEEGLSKCGCGDGMIHATPQVATYWFQNGNVFRENGKIVTGIGTLVVVGGGYDGSGTNGQAAASGSVWAYGTGLVTVRLGAIEHLDEDDAAFIDRSTNTVTRVAERLVLYSWEPCCHVAASIDIDVCQIGS